MTTPADLLKRVEKINQNEIVDKSINDTSDLYANLQVEQQLQGLKADGSQMPFYSYASVIIFGKEPGPIKLRDTGAFQTEIIAWANNGLIDVRSEDWKDSMLRERYGEDIFGLSDKYKQEYRQELEPVTINNFRKELQL